MLQIQEGVFAPGDAAHVPADSRFQENKIPDGELERLQQILASYLLDHGFSDNDSPGVQRGRVACGL